MEEVVTWRQGIGAAEVNVHDPTADDAHVRRCRRQCRFIVRKLLVLGTSDVVNQYGFHANRAVAKVLDARL